MREGGRKGLKEGKMEGELRTPDILLVVCTYALNCSAFKTK